MQRLWGVFAAGTLLPVRAVALYVLPVRCFVAILPRIARPVGWMFGCRDLFRGGDAPTRR